MDLPFRFNVTRPPYKHFSDLVQWRVNSIHHIPKFTKIIKYNGKSYKGNVRYTYSLFKVDHAKLAIDAVNNMFSNLSEGGKFRIPIWLEISPYV
jgi:hypothetical protein